MPYRGRPWRTAVWVAILAALLLAALLLWSYRPMREPANVAEVLPQPCRDVQFDGGGFIVCAVDPARLDIMLALKDTAGKPYERLDRLPGPYLFAMNAGMYHEDFSPVGLFVEDGLEQSPLNTADGDGNFFMKPNGVFFVDKTGKAGVLETSAYETAKPDVAFSTQSGPMLVIDGTVHPRFESDGSSKYIRNGVGVDNSGQAVFAISRREVSLGKFARLFRDGLGCPNALFFDGGISALYDGRRYIVGGEHPVGPIAVVKSN